MYSIGFFTAGSLAVLAMEVLQLGAFPTMAGVVAGTLVGLFMNQRNED